MPNQIVVFDTTVLIPMILSASRSTRLFHRLDAAGWQLPIAIEGGPLGQNVFGLSCDADPPQSSGRNHTVEEVGSLVVVNAADSAKLFVLNRSVLRQVFDDLLCDLFELFVSELGHRVAALRPNPHTRYTVLSDGLWVQSNRNQAMKKWTFTQKHPLAQLWRLPFF